MGGTDNTLVFYVNGRKVEDSCIDPEWTLLHYLRDKLRLCGTKLGCGVGGCGACTVMISSFDRFEKKPVHWAARACLIRVASLHGLAVTTVEGIGSTRTKLHPVQKRIAEAHGSQCGFCTPGMVMAMYALLRNSPTPTMYQIENALRGNLCRCTGYRPILEGFSSFAQDGKQWKTLANGMDSSDGECLLGDKCCKNRTNGGTDIESQAVHLFNKNEYTPFDPSQEAIFPPELQLSSKFEEKTLILQGKRITWYRPTTLKELLNLKSRFKNQAHIIVGNTNVGLVEAKSQSPPCPVLIHPCIVSELTTITENSTGLRVGAAVTISRLQEALETSISSQPEHKTRLFSAIVNMIEVFASQQIRNVSCVGGNIMVSSPLSDLNPIYMVSGCELEVQSQERGLRTIVINQTFFNGKPGKRNVIEDDEVILAVNIPYTKENQYVEAYKQSKRHYVDSAVVNMAVNVEFESGTNNIENIEIAFGGISYRTVCAQKTREFLLRKEWKEDVIESAYDSLLEDLPLPPGSVGSMEQYRRSLALGLFLKAYLSINKQLVNNKIADIHPISKSYESALISQWGKPLKSSQYFQVVPENQKDYDPIGRPVVHKAAFKQATGEAVYCDDLPHYENELYLALLVSSRPHARVLSTDASRALAMEGVHAFFSADDLTPEQNTHGLARDEHVFAPGEVTCVGHVLGAVVAETKHLAQQAVRSIVVEYEDLYPAIITLEDAIEKQSFLDEPKTMSSGDIEEAFKKADHELSGEVRMGGQDHFYLETHCAIAVPKGEDKEMEMICSSQFPSEVQRLVANMIGVQRNKVVCRVRRMGGGFGGKETRPYVLYMPVAFAAYKLQRPVRCMLDRDEDMQITGMRHPFIAKYRVAFTKEGQLLGCDMKMYSNGGNTHDLSEPVMERAMTHFQNSYVLPAMRCTGYKCRSNIPSNTVFRGAGGPQGMFFAENMIRDIATFLKKDPTEISILNMYKEGDITPYNQVLQNVTVRRCWDECLSRSDFLNRKSNIQEFNRHNRWKKRGIAAVPTAYGVGYTLVFLNQAGALVLVYGDGSVLLTHGGCESGQGLHTKMIQVASRALGISDEYIHTTEIATDKVPNTTPTSASVGSDLNGMAVLNACEKIVERLKPFKEANPKGHWSDWVAEAYRARVNLSATGFYKTPDVDYDWDKMTGNMYNYFTYGAACSEVEIDCLTGDHKVLRTDIVMDLGQSLNPAIDVGQVEGGFIQGYGLYVLEELRYSPQGKLLTNGPGFYKIPTVSDIPTEFNVSLLQGSSNPRAIYSSKAVGEPPLFLASSIFFAIKDAISAARADVDLTGLFQLDSPATAERIRTACVDNLINKIPKPEAGTYTPWSVPP
ncbi:xanthine dehydrogenase-like [Periplaneta americana]|uniref:xanthine dehydrogenase-like n=1 Tax=Periplaneta americana TaxID=6978 RepID=UPI0037E73654